jgi:hypothetical protein
LLVRHLTCTGCGAIFAQQLTSDPPDPESGGLPVGWYAPFPSLGTTLRSEMVRLPRLSPRGLPVYGQQSARRRGRRPHADRRREQVVELSLAVVNLATSEPFIPPEKLELARLGRQRATTVRAARVLLRPASDEWLPGEPHIWFNRDVELPCELYCYICGRLHLLSGQGPEGAPPADTVPTSSEDDEGR